MTEVEPRRADPDARRPPEGVVIRVARPSDAASYLRMWRSVFAERRYVRTEHVPHGVRHYRRFFRDASTADHVRLVAVAGDEVVGTISLERLPHPVNRHVATLGMAVLAGWRGRGVGAALMASGVRWARAAGVEKLTLEVYTHNEPAIALYRQFGFAEEGRLARHSKKSHGYEDELVMGRLLT